MMEDSPAGLGTHTLKTLEATSSQDALCGSSLAGAMPQPPVSAASELTFASV